MADCTIIDKLNYILETKDLIKTALETQDIEVLESDTFRKYSEYVTEIRKVASVNGETGDIILKTINGQNLVGEGNIVIQGGEGGGSEPEQYIKMLGEEYSNNLIWYTNEKDDYREIKFKTINGNTIMGEGDITIEGGGGSVTAGVNKIIMGEEDYGWNTYKGDVKLTNGWMDLDDDGVAETYDIRIGDNSGSSLWFGFNSTDNSIKIEDNGSRLSFTVNPDILGGGGGSVTESDPIFTEWKNGDSIALGKDSTNEGSNNIAIGNTVKVNGEYSIAIGADNNINNASVALGMSNTITSENSLALGNDNKLKDGSFKFAYGYFNEPKNDQEINIGILCDSKTGETDAEKTHFVISSAQNSKGEEISSCFEIRNDDSIYIKMNGQLVKLQDKLNINIPETDLSNYYTKTETYSKDEVDDLLENSGSGTAGVTAINIGRDIQDWTQKNGVVSFYSDWYDGSYDVAIGGTSFFGIKPIDNSIILENAGGTVNGNTRCGIKINTDNFKTINGESIIGEGNITIEGGSGSGTINIIELTQAEYDALTEYADNTFYVITDANKQYTTLEEVEQQGYLKAIPDTYVTDGELSTAISDKVSQTALNEAIEGLASEQWVEDKKYLTEHQQLKTINGESIVGEGNITIEGGSGSETDPVFTEWKDKTIQVIIGSGATGSDNTQFDNISIGRGARGGIRTVAIGGYSYIDSKYSTSLGTNTKSSADATYSVIIGYSASGNSENSVAIGTKAKVESGVTNGCAIGANTESNATFNTNINNVLKGDTSNYAYILDADGNYVKIIDTYYTKTEIDNLIGGVSDKISDINSMI